MTCATVREQLDAPAIDAAAMAHLETCSGCRAEAAFRRRLGVVVTAMPRASAPEGFAAHVMAEVAERAAAQPASRGLDLALRPWEMGGIAAVCLVLLALAPLLWGASVVDSWQLSAGRVANLGVLADAWQRLVSLAANAQLSTLTWPSTWPGAPLAWLCGAAAFAAALYVLLSWRANGFVSADGEDVYA